MSRFKKLDLTSEQMQARVDSFNKTLQGMRKEAEENPQSSERFYFWLLHQLDTGAVVIPDPQVPGEKPSELEHPE